MNCAPSDLRDFYFEALDAAEMTRMREHVGRCEPCGAELERLRVTALTLAALPQEEIPRRIAFVSDKVFEPSTAARWWRAFWFSGARMLAGATALLAVAIVFHSYRQPQPRIETVRAATAPVPVGDIQASIDKAVAKAVTETEARYDAKLRKLAAADTVQIRDYMERTQETLNAMDRRSRVLTVASNRLLETGQ